MDFIIKGDIASGTADTSASAPVKIGARALSALAATTTGKRVNAIADLFGRILVGHIAPEMQTWKSANYTTAQTGVALWTPAAGKKIAITSLIVAPYGATAARAIVWFGAVADGTYTAGTDQLVTAASFIPNTNKTPLVLTPSVPMFCPTVNYELKLTTDADLSVDITIYGYEF